jgi:dsDNA-binding SOS-regulon protein
LAHIDDHKDGEFPGGEGVAESRENSFTPNFGAASITNVGNKVISPLELSKNGDIKMKKEIIKLANHLDKLGHSDLADRLDTILKSATQMTEEESRIKLMAILSEQVESTEPVSEETKEIARIQDAPTVDAPDGQPVVEPQFALDPTLASNRIDEMAKLISREFSLISGGNVNRD